MGVPKFYRWLSERYPCINESVNQYNIPEFDYFYVDMNGVFHTCSHPSDDVQFRLSESQIFENISTYIEFLFNLVQPKKAMFLSVDGVAPRSKMNQQRSRRFKTAKEAIEKESKAKQLGQIIPDDPRFDSNCITPGTQFMDKLHKYLVKYLSNKIQHNQAWKEVEIIYSGHDVPGEGEHKIMDYIRYCKTSNVYQSTTVRHCLYGLDADLINLGLSSHEPYFSLLREEVTFTKSNNKRHCDPFKTNFQLLHLSILRDYLNHEFIELEKKLKFNYDIEKIIDDWILLNFLVGNDFLPHIPKFHVDKGSIQVLYDNYKAVMPTLDGYLNEDGLLNLPRYKVFLQRLTQHDVDVFSENGTDLKYFNSDFNDITFGDKVDLYSDPLESSSDTSTDEGDEEEEKDSSDYDFDREIKDEFVMHKTNYYKTKLKFTDLKKDVVQFANEYIKGIQWVLHYYFNGCVSWNWFYPFYYAPYVSDLANFDVSFDFNFQLSTPFKPLQQLLAVIPQASRDILPKAFHRLTYDPDSPLIKFFPTDVIIDLNEKIHDYEAIILIPFIDENALLTAFQAYENQLSADELNRNKFGFHYSLKYSDSPPASAETDSELPNVTVTKIDSEHYSLPIELIYKGVRKGVNVREIIGFPTLNGISYKSKLEYARIKVFNFPSKHLNMLLEIEKTERTDEELIEFGKNYLGKLVYINWPLLTEAKLVELIDSEHKYKLNSNKVQIEKVDKIELAYAKQFAKSYCSSLQNKKGVILNKVSVIAKVAPLLSQKYIVNGAKVILHKEWSKSTTDLPLDFVVYETPSHRQQSQSRSLSLAFTKGKSFFLVDQPFYGYKTNVIEYIKSKNLVHAQVRVTSEPDFSDIKENFDYILRENYLLENKLIYDIKRKHNLIDSSVRRMLGSVLVTYKHNNGPEKKMNIGFKLKYKSNYEQKIKPCCVPGYSMVVENDLFYSRKVIGLFDEYVKKFPFVFTMFVGPYKSMFDIEDLFSDQSVPVSDKIKQLFEIKNWIDSLEPNKIGHVKPDVEYLDNCIVKAIEEAVETHTVLMTEEKVVDQHFAPSSFYIPEFVLKGSTIPDPKAKFYLFDRVVNIKIGIAVPYGTKGTIIGIYRKCDEISNNRDAAADSTENENETQDYLEELLSSVIEVLFDETFDGALLTRSTKRNIYKMQAAWLINITYGLMHAKKTNNFRNVYQSIQSSQYNNNINNNKNYQKSGKGVSQAANSHSVKNNKQQQQQNVVTYNNSNNNKQATASNNNNNKNDSNSHKFNHSVNSPFKILSKKAQSAAAAAAAAAIRTSTPLTENYAMSIAPPTPAALPLPANSTAKTRRKINLSDLFNNCEKNSAPVAESSSGSSVQPSINLPPQQSKVLNGVAPPTVLPPMPFVSSLGNNQRKLNVEQLFNPAGFTAQQQMVTAATIPNVIMPGIMIGAVPQIPAPFPQAPPPPPAQLIDLTPFPIDDNNQANNLNSLFNKLTFGTPFVPAPVLPTTTTPNILPAPVEIDATPPMQWIKSSKQKYSRPSKILENVVPVENVPIVGHPQESLVPNEIVAQELTFDSQPNGGNNQLIFEGDATTTANNNSIQEKQQQAYNNQIYLGNRHFYNNNYYNNRGHHPQYNNNMQNWNNYGNNYQMNGQYQNGNYNQYYNPNNNYNYNAYNNNRAYYNNNQNYDGYNQFNNTSNNFNYDVSLNQQAADVKQFVPLQVARNYQHERTSKLKQHYPNE